MFQIENNYDDDADNYDNDADRTDSFYYGEVRIETEIPEGFGILVETDPLNKSIY